MMLSEQEITFLSKMRFSSETDSINPDSLLNCKTLIESLGKSMEAIKGNIGTTEDKVAASLLIKRYAFLPVIGLVMMSAFNKKLNYAIENVALLYYEADGLWLPRFSFFSMEVVDISQEREDWRRLIVKELFAQHIYKLMEVVSKTTKTSKLILWENVAVYLFWLYEMLQEMYKNSPIKERIEDDFRFLLSEEAAVLYGKYHANPINRYFFEKTVVNIGEEPVRVRMTCCLSNRLENKVSCKTCPQTCKSQIKNKTELGVSS